MTVFKSILMLCSGVSCIVATSVGAASISLSDAMRDFPGDDGELTAPLAGADVPDTDRSVFNVGDTPVINVPGASNMGLPLEDLQPDIYQFDAPGTMMEQTDKIMNDDGTMGGIPFQL